MVEIENGRWNPTALRRAAAAAEAEWSGLPGRAYSLMLGRQCIAAVRQRGRGRWHATIEGFEFRVTPDMGVAKVVPGLKFAVVKGFGSSRDARSAVDRVFRAAAQQPITPNGE